MSDGGRKRSCIQWNYQGGPCKDCPERQPACSGHCEKYKEWRRGYDEFMATRKKEQRAMIDVACVRFGKKPRRKKAREQ